MDTITKKEIDKSFENTNFGESSNEEVLKRTLLKFACGYHSGHTATCIVKELNLVNERGKLTEEGQRYLYEAYEGSLIQKRKS